jgi:hypothetical protein
MLLPWTQKSILRFLSQALFTTSIAKGYLDTDKNNASQKQDCHLEAFKIQEQKLITYFFSSGEDHGHPKATDLHKKTFRICVR